MIGLPTNRGLRRVLGASLLTLVACHTVHLHEDYGPLEQEVRDEVCECDAETCAMIDGELWVDATSELSCVQSAIFHFDPAYEHANCRYGSLEQLLDCLQLRSCGPSREPCFAAFREDARTCERTQSDVAGRLAVEVCRMPESDLVAISEYFEAVSDGLSTRCTVAGSCETTIDEFRACLGLPLDASAAYYARCSGPGWRLYDRCIRERGSTRDCEHVLTAAIACDSGNPYSASVNRCLNYIR
ncbi:MAG: hypothetical protein KC586_14485 [Myxococcales bacterium]|nr:hypothetical protein [Myxococcales bacterium]